MKPAEYLESVKDRLSTDSSITRSRIIREYSNPETAHLRARLKLKNAPHHIHTPIGEAEEEVTPGTPTNIFAILDEIAKINDAQE
ncbi:MAG: hypothetical protein ABIL11_10030 [Chloroflexota bacterium]